MFPDVVFKEIDTMVEFISHLNRIWHLPLEIKFEPYVRSNKWYLRHDLSTPTVTDCDTEPDFQLVYVRMIKGLYCPQYHLWLAEFRVWEMDVHFKGLSGEPVDHYRSINDYRSATLVWEEDKAESRILFWKKKKKNKQ